MCDDEIPTFEYIADLCGTLATMAEDSGNEALKYLLKMAEMEARGSTVLGQAKIEQLKRIVQIN